MKRITNKKYFNTENFRIFLQKELTERIKRNNRFSLRAFAKLLDIDSGQLSRIINGKRTANTKTINKIIKCLSPNPEQFELFTYSENKSACQRFETISLDSFQVISDWYHFAILELLRVEGFQSSHTWIADKLGITKIEAAAAIERLIRLEYLEDENDKYTDISGLLTTERNDFTTSAFKQMQKQILERAISAIDEIEFEKRS